MAKLESSRKEAEASFCRAQREADAATYKQGQLASAQLVSARKDTDAAAYKHNQLASAKLEASKKDAEAAFLLKTSEAQGVSALAKAYGEMANVLRGPQGLMQYLMLQDNLYEKLALANAQAVKGLQPKINVWTTGGGENGAQDPAASIRNIFQTLPPLMDTVSEQTGMKPPGWLMQMPESTEQKTREAGKEISTRKSARVNGDV